MAFRGFRESEWLTFLGMAFRGFRESEWLTFLGMAFRGFRETRARYLSLTVWKNYICHTSTH